MSLCMLLQLCVFWVSLHQTNCAGEFIISVTSGILDIHFNDFMFNRFFNYMLNKYDGIEAVFKQFDNNRTWFNYNVTEITTSHISFTKTNVYDCNLGNPTDYGLINCTRWMTDSTCPELVTTCSPNYIYVISERFNMYLAGSEIRNCKVTCTDKVRTFYYRVEANVTSTVAPSTSVRTTVPIKPTTRNGFTISTPYLTSSSTVTADTSSSSTSSTTRSSVLTTIPSVSPTTSTTTVSSETWSSALTTTPTMLTTTIADSRSSVTFSMASTTKPSISTNQNDQMTSTSISTTQSSTILVSQNISTPTSSPNDYTTNCTKPSTDNTNDKKTRIIIISVSVAGAVVLVLCCIVAVVVCKHRKKKVQEKKESGVGAPRETHENKLYQNYSVEENAIATPNSSEGKSKTSTSLITNKTGSTSLRNHETEPQNDAYTILEDGDDYYRTPRQSDVSNSNGYYSNLNIMSTHNDGDQFSNNSTDTNFTILQCNNYENVNTVVHSNSLETPKKHNYQILNGEERREMENSYLQLLPLVEEIQSEQESSSYSLAKPVLEKKTLQIIDVEAIADGNTDGITDLLPYKIPQKGDTSKHESNEDIAIGSLGYTLVMSNEQQ